MGKALFAFDVAAIKSYVFATDRLRSIRGASARLDKLNRRYLEEAARTIDPQLEVVFAGGGGGLFVVDANRVADLPPVLDRACRERTETVELRCAWLEIATADAVTPAEIALLQARLRAARGVNPEIVGAPAQGFFMPCEMCGEHPVTEQRRLAGVETALCRACDLKVAEDREYKTRDDPGSWTGLRGQLAELPPVEAILRGRSRPRDVDELGEQGQPAGTIAVLYADGDGLGHLFDDARSLADLSAWSRAIEQSLLEALAAAVLDPLRPADDRKVLPFDILLCGGDDLVIATTADRALATARVLVATFFEKSKAHLGRPFSLSTGLAFAPAHYPFRQLLDLAEGALGQAKRERAWRLAGGQLTAPAAGLISYIVVNAAGQVDFRTFEAEMYESATPGGDPALRRLLRPFSLTELERVTKAARELADLPRTRLEALRATTFLSHRAAALQGLTVLSHLNDKQHDLVWQVLTRLANGRRIEFPWFYEGEELVNPWHDLAEVAELV